MAEKKNVRIRLFKDNSRYKGDLFVSVNGCLLYTSDAADE